MSKMLRFESFEFPLEPYIDLEGIVGVGKTTQVNLLKVSLRADFPDREFVFVHEPGGTPICNDIRMVVQGKEYPEDMTPECELLLYTANRAQRVRTEVRPALDRGAVVISDRSFWTSGSYQGYARGLGLEVVFQATRIAVGNNVPSRVFVLDRSLELAISAAQDKPGDKFESTGEEFFKKARSGYLEMAEKYPHIIEVVDANGTIEQVHERLSLSVVRFLREEVGINQ